MAAGNTLITFDAGASSPPVAGYATLDVRNTHFVLDFDPAVNEAIHFEGVIPRHYTGLGITARVYWMATQGVGPGFVVAWQVKIEKHGHEGMDLDGDNYTPGGAGGYSTAPAINGQLAYLDMNFSDVAGIVGGEHFRITVTRIANDPSDNLPFDAELLAVELREQGGVEIGLTPA